MQTTYHNIRTLFTNTTAVSHSSSLCLILVRQESFSTLPLTNKQWSACNVHSYSTWSISVGSTTNYTTACITLSAHLKQLTCFNKMLDDNWKSIAKMAVNKLQRQHKTLMTRHTCDSTITIQYSSENLFFSNSWHCFLTLCEYKNTHSCRVTHFRKWFGFLGPLCTYRHTPLKALAHHFADSN